MHIDNIYTKLIIRHLTKEISEEDKHVLFKWVYANSENEKFFYNIKDIWETARYESLARGAETDAEWERLALAAVKEESKYFYEKRTITRKIYRIIQIAAIAVITFGVGFLVQKYIPAETTYTKIIVPYGAKSELELPDGSRIWVNSGSTFKYPTNLENKEIDLFLEGEAYFEIIKNPNRKINVKTSTINIQVLGTSFNVKSYNEEDVVETTLVHGSISITGEVGHRVIKDPILLKPNEQAILTKSKSSVEVGETVKENTDSADYEQTISDHQNVINKSHPRLKISENIDVESFISWKNNVLLFKNERFQDLAVKLERWYNVEIIINDVDLNNSRYTGTFEKETLEQAIEALSMSLPFSYKINKNKIEIIKKKC